jgi:tetratricopeptide (TPR) repeat protein
MGSTAGGEFGRVSATQQARLRPRSDRLSALDAAGLRRRVELARADVDAGRGQAAGQALAQVLQDIDRLSSSRLPGTAEDSELRVIEASACSLHAQLSSPPDEPAPEELDLLERAANVLELLVGSGQANARAWADYGAAIDILGRTKEAEDALRTAVTHGELSQGTHHRLARILLADGRADEAEQVLRRVLKTDAVNDPTTLRLLGDSLQMRHRNAEAAAAYLAVAKLSVASGRLQHAVEVARLASELMPASFEASLVLGDTLRLLSRHDEALTALDAALLLSPDDQRALAAKADVLRITGDFEGALQTLDALLAQSPDDAFTLGMKGDVLRAVGAYAEALPVLDAAVKSAPDDAWNVGTRGQVLRALGRIDEAVVALTTALQHSDSLPWVWAELAAAELDRGRLDAALAAAGEALQRDPEQPVALAVRASVHAQRGHAAPAEEALLALVQAQPDLEWGWRLLAEVQIELGKDEEALSAMHNALNVKPDDEATAEMLVDLLMRAGRVPEALGLLDRFTRTDPPPDWVLLYQGVAFRRSGQLEDSIRTLEHAAQVVPEDARIRGQLGEALADAGRADDALAAFNDAVQLGGSLSDLLDEMIALADQPGRSDVVLELLHRLLREQPANTDIRRQTAKLEYQLGRYEDAARTFDEEGSDGEWSPEDLSRRGEVLRVLGRTREARTSFERALELDPDSVSALTGLLYVYLDLRKPKRARVYAVKALEGRERNPSLLGDLALVDLAEEKYVEALDRTSLALGIEPENEWARVARGRVLNQMGDWSQAVQTFEPLVQSGATASTIYELAWACENAALRSVADRATPDQVVLHDTARTLLDRAREAYEQAWAQERDNVWYRRGVADTSDLRGLTTEADEHYRGIVEQVESNRAYDTDSLGLLAWCNYCLDQGEVAMTLYINAISSASPTADYLKFDLGLAMLASGQFELAQSTYQRGVGQLAGLDRHRQRAAMLVARNDLTAARLLHRVGSDDVTGSIVLMLDSNIDALSAAGVPTPEPAGADPEESS